MLSRLFVVFLVFSSLAVACGSDSKPPLGKTCIVNSDCNNPLSCTFGKCHEACRQTVDCPAGQTCIKGPADPMTMIAVNVCQLPEDRGCAYHSDCKAPLKCARDLKCRNECRTDVDCNPGQMCAQGDQVCADAPDIMSGMLKNTIDGSVPNLRPGVDTGATGGTDSSVATTDGGVTPTSDGGVAQSDVPVGGGSDGSRNVPDVEVPVSGVTAVPATVRQGGMAIITVTGTNLSNPGEFQLGDLTPSLEPGATDTMFKLSVLVKHGATLGPRSLTFSTSGGRGSKDNALTVSAITSGPMGNDMTNDGSSASPFRTFKRALQVATAGDTVQLLDGTYRLADGETWMVPIPDKVIVQGQSAAGTQLIGPGETGGNVSADGLTFTGEATVKNLSVTAFQYNVYITKANANVTLENVKATNARANNLYVSGMGSKVTLAGMENDFSKSTSTAMVLAAAMVTLSGSGAGPIGSLANGYGLQINATGAKVDLTGFTFTANMGGYNAVYTYQADTALKFSKTTFEDTVLVQGAMSTLELNEVTAKVLPTVNYAIDFHGKTLIVTGSTLEGSRYGVNVNNGMGEARFRGTTIKGYTNAGIYVQAGKVDMGTDKERGNNIFMGPETGAYGLDDQRQSATVEITVSNTTFNGFRPPAGAVMAATSNQAEPGKYRIRSIGNKIVFFEL